MANLRQRSKYAIVAAPKESVGTIRLNMDLRSEEKADLMQLFYCAHVIIVQARTVASVNNICTCFEVSRQLQYSAK